MAQLTEAQMRAVIEDELISNFMQDITKRKMVYNKYKGNWYKLMQVIDKIEETEIREGSFVDVFIGPHNYTFINITDYNKEFVGDGLTKVDSLYDCIIKFLTWYNTDRIYDEIVNDNVLLAEFLDLKRKKFNSGLYNYQFDDKWYESHELSFDKSWDWLLLVTSKILTNGMPKVIDSLYFDIEKNLKLGNLKECYDLSVQYIKNYY